MSPQGYAAVLVALLTISCTPGSIRSYRAHETAESARLLALEAETHPGPALTGLEELARDARTPTVAARAAVRAGDRHLDADREAEAAGWWRVATRLDPTGSWARAGVERLHHLWRDLPAAGLEEQLETLRHPALDGQLLYLAAARHASEGSGRVRAVELCLQQRRLAPRSSFRDDCEDLVLSLLDREDRIRFAEDLLIPQPTDDPAAMTSPRFQGIELHLAEDLAAAGRTEDALRRLRRVVDRYPSLKHKDDALWRMAVLYRQAGDKDQERAALRTLIDNLPHSRFAADAAQRLDALP